MNLYKYKGKTYLIAKFAQMKCPQTGAWVDAVVYVGDEPSLYYVRDKDDFYDKFLPVDNFDGCSQQVFQESTYKTAYESAAKERDRYKKVFDALMVIKEELERG